MYFKTHLEIQTIRLNKIEGAELIAIFKEVLNRKEPNI